MSDIETATRELVAAIRAEIAASRGGEPQPDRLLSVPDAAHRIGVGRSMLYEEIAAGRLRSMKVGRRRLIPQGAISDYIRNAAPPDAA
jgi:excisionase family DNA binding protein